MMAKKGRQKEIGSNPGSAKSVRNRDQSRLWKPGRNWGQSRLCETAKNGVRFTSWKTLVENLGQGGFFAA